MGKLLEAAGKHVLAVIHYQTAAALLPDRPEAFCRLGDAYMAEGKDEPALAAYDRALRADPRDSAAHYHQALTLLAAGHFGRGWQGFGWRWRVPHRRRLREAALPLWEGKSTREARLLVEDEGEPVEDIVFSQCLGDLLALGVKVVFRGDAGLAALLRRAFPALETLAEGEALPPLDAAISLGSLPALFRRRKPDFRRPAGYLIANLRAATDWRTRYRALGPGRTIGIAWRDEAMWPVAEPPKLPPAALAPILTLPEIRLVSLETSEDQNEANILSGIGVWPDPGADLDALAARIDAADVVIALPGRAAALAGALGKPLFLLAPAVPGWLWGLRGGSLPWLPSAFPIRLRPGQDWDKAVASLLKSLPTALAAVPLGPRAGRAPRLT